MGGPVSRGALPYGLQPATLSSVHRGARPCLLAARNCMSRVSAASSSTDDEPSADLQPPLRAKGSYHPKACGEAASASALTAADEPAGAPLGTPLLEQALQPSPSPGAGRRALAVLVTLLVGALSVAASAVSLALLRPSALVLVLPNAVSLVGDAAIVASWLAFPELRTAHGGHVLWLSVAQSFYSADAIAEALSPRCPFQQAATTAWACTWLWTAPVAVDWLLLLLHERGAGSHRAALSRWCHAAWPSAVLLTLPFFLSAPRRLRVSPPELALLADYCVPEDSASSHRALLVLLLPYALTNALLLLVFVIGLRRSAADAVGPPAARAPHRQLEARTAPHASPAPRRRSPWSSASGNGARRRSSWRPPSRSTRPSRCCTCTPTTCASRRPPPSVGASPSPPAPSAPPTRWRTRWCASAASSPSRGRRAIRPPGGGPG